MNLNKFTEKAQEAVMTAQNLASEGTHAEITPEHLLVALVEQENGIVPSLLRKMTLDPRKVAAEARTLLDSLPKAYGADVRLSPRMNLIGQSAQAEATRLQDEYVSTEHLLLALASEAGRSPSAQLLKRFGSIACASCSMPPLHPVTGFPTSIRRRKPPRSIRAIPMPSPSISESRYCFTGRRSTTSR